RRRQSDRGGESIFRSARRDGHELDSEPPALSARNGRRRHRGSVRKRGTGAMTTAIRSTAVLGAGTMGAQIAAHLANAGVPALLLDLTADIAGAGLKRARALKPDPFFTPAAAALVSTGGFDADLARLSTAD